ncbi:iSSod6 transposase [Vibrio cholerae CT 5369-93]|nr:iSSod6 transposase [Vibrio cholerae CT 5369-93]
MKGAFTACEQKSHGVIYQQSLGDWCTVYRRFNLWSKKGLLEILFKELSKLSDYDWVFADSSIVKAHQHNS